MNTACQLTSPLALPVAEPTISPRRTHTSARFAKRRSNADLSTPRPIVQQFSGLAQNAGSVPSQRSSIQGHPVTAVNTASITRSNAVCGLSAYRVAAFITARFPTGEYAVEGRV
jgi:hypothetical protein